MSTFSKGIVAVALAAAGLVASGSASAHYWGPRVGVVIGVPFPYYSPWYYPPPVYYDPPPVIVAPPAPAVAQPQSQYWYYCADSKMYYPYAKECPSGWQPVTPQPQGAAPAH
jgi:hypothetical protein